MRRYDVATSGEQRPTINLYKIACIVNNNVPPAIKAPLQDVLNILDTNVQWRRNILLHITFVIYINIQEETMSAQNNRWYLCGAIGGLAD